MSPENIPQPSAEVNPWSEEAFNAKRDEARPTAESPMMFDVEDALKFVQFEQVKGESLRGRVDGYFYNEQGEKINLVTLNRKSAELAGWNNEEKGYMKVPEFAVIRHEADVAAPEDGEQPLTEAQENIADEAIKDAAGLEDPSKVDEEAHNYSSEEVKAMREAARRIVEDETPVVPNLEQPVTKSPEQAAYDAVKEEMFELTEAAELSESDKFYLDQYVQAGPTRYDEQAIATTKMSKELLNNSELIHKYQALYDKRWQR